MKVPLGACGRAKLTTFPCCLAVASRFVWNCFLQPLGKNADQAGRLDRFYKGQADIYDATRSKLLRGRGTMLKLSAAHLKEQRKKDPSKRLVWLDIGGGTGWNVEEMDKVRQDDRQHELGGRADLVRAVLPDLRV